MFFKNTLLAVLVLCFSACDSNDEAYQEQLARTETIIALRHQARYSPEVMRPDTLTIDGIKAVRIAKVIWATENLNTATYCNGDTIPEVTETAAWRDAEFGAWSYYNNDPKFGERFGRIYNWYAVNDSRGLCPCGWQVASDAQWLALVRHFGGIHLAPIYLLAATEWEINEPRSTNSGFNALRGGYRPTPEGAQDGSDFDGLSGGVWWTSTREANHNGLFYISEDAYAMDISETVCYRSKNGWFVGQSVRCVLSIEI